MRSRLAHLLTLIAVLLVMEINAPHGYVAAARLYQEPNMAAAGKHAGLIKAAVPDCKAQPVATAAAAATMQAISTATTQPATQAVTQATAQATTPATETARSLLRMTTFEPTDFKFNPNPDKPVALVIVFSLVFQSESDSEMSVQHPRLKLAIDGVPWGDLSSTDFQTGILRAHATQGIVLQSLLLVPRATDDQKAMFECIKNSIPVDLTLTGTFEAYPGGAKQTVEVSFLTPQTVIRPHP